MLWLDNDIPSPGELQPLQEDAFWASPTRARYHAINGPRISSLNTDDQVIYDYDVESDTGGEMEASEDDYVDI